MTDREYAFDHLPVDPVRGGTNLLVAGPKHAGAREVTLRLLSQTDEEGVIIVTTNTNAANIAADCAAMDIQVTPDRTAIVDCLDGDPDGVPARVMTVSSVEDLTGIGMRYSKSYTEFHQAGIERVRTGLLSVSTILSLTDLQTTSRFLHTLSGRITSVDGFGAFHIDPAMHDDQSLQTLSQFCDGRIDVREDADAGRQLRVRGPPGADREWRGFDL